MHTLARLYKKLEKSNIPLKKVVNVFNGQVNKFTMFQPHKNIFKNCVV